MGLKIIPRINGTILGPFGYALERTRPTRAEIEEADRAPRSVPVEEVQDFRSRSNDWTYSVPVTHMVSRPLFGYGPNSWHPLKAGAAELLADIDIPYEASILPRFYETFAPKSMAEAYRLDRDSKLRGLSAARLLEAWTLSAPPRDDPFTEDFPSGTPLFGPCSPQEGEEEWRRLRRCVESLQEYGYRPGLFEKGRINVTVLRSRGEERYVVEHGIHRTSVLSAMGMTRIDVGIDPRNPWVVDEDEADQWPHVKSGFMTEEEAVETLRRYFTTPESDPALEIAAACGAIPTAAPQGS